MCVSRRMAGVFGLLFVLSLPRAAAAAAILHEFDITPDGSSQLLEGTFAWDNDVVLVHFVLGEGEYALSALTTSFAEGGFDPLMSLYYAATPTDPMLHYTYIGADGGEYSAENFDDIDFENGLWDSALTFSLTQAGVYTLALTQAGNLHQQELLFDWDADEFRCGASIPEICETPSFNGYSSLFSLNVTLTSATAAVPEPGTLSLIGIGLSALGFVRRRVGHRSTRS
jgi:hypothetical protein